MKTKRKTAILLVSFGTSHIEAGEKSLELIYKELSELDETIQVYQAYTSQMIIRKLAGRKIEKNSVEDAIIEAISNQAERLLVIPTHMIPGNEYHKMKTVLEQYQAFFQELKIASAVLNEVKDCNQLIPILSQMFEISSEYEYLLMGHGTKADANLFYEHMNQAFLQKGYTNVRIASVEAKPDLEDAIAILREKKTHKKIILHPFMVVAGEHAKQDMAGGEDSFATRLAEEGYQVEAVVKGLGEYPQFRELYRTKLKKLLEES